MRRTVAPLLLALAAFGIVTPRAMAVNCSFLPETPMPQWVVSRPEMRGYYVGVGSAGPHQTVQEQVEASQNAALAAIAKEITVSVQSTFTDILSENGGAAEQEITSVTEARVSELLRGAMVKEKWLDRKNCLLWTLATVSKESVAAVQKEIDEKIRKKFTSKKAMLFALASPARPGPVETRALAALTKVMGETGVKVLTPAEKFLPCAKGQYTPLCDESAGTIFGGITMEFNAEKLSADGRYKARFFSFGGALYYRDRAVSSFQIKCKGVGDAAQDSGAIDLIAADQCVADVKKKLKNDLQGSE